jgi:methionyl aminopeptidase
MWKGIALVRPGARLGDIGHAIEAHAASHGYTCVRNYCGHGIGRGFHEPPNVRHYGEPGTGLQLVPGMVFTIEPMLNAGAVDTVVLPDSWTVATLDGSLSAQWEHTIAVTQTGHEVLTTSAGCPRALRFASIASSGMSAMEVVIS